MDRGNYFCQIDSFPYLPINLEKEHDITYYSDFEYLYHKMLKVEIQQTKKNTIELTREDLKKFLREELIITIRHSKPHDLAEVMRIEKAAFKVDGYNETKFKELYKNYPEGVFVAVLFEEIVGYCIGYVTKTMSELDSIAVDPDYQKLGIGKRLFTMLYKSLKNQGATKCTLEVRKSNTDAVRFYESLGFKIIGTEESYYSDGGDAYVMEIPIPPI